MVFAARQVTMMVLAASLCFSAISLVTSRLAPFKECLSFSTTRLATRTTGFYVEVWWSIDTSIKLSATRKSFSDYFNIIDKKGKMTVILQK